jgi:hypothetical protein
VASISSRASPLLLRRDAERSLDASHPAEQGLGRSLVPQDELAHVGLGPVGRHLQVAQASGLLLHVERLVRPELDDLLAQSADPGGAGRSVGSLEGSQTTGHDPSAEEHELPEQHYQDIRHA